LGLLPVLLQQEQRALQQVQVLLLGEQPVQQLELRAQREVLPVLALLALEQLAQVMRHRNRRK
jgi:hypothetical protein